MQAYKEHIKSLQLLNNISEVKFKAYEKDLLKLSKSLKHNLIVFKNETNPNIYYFITKTTDLNAFESEFKSKLINIKQTDKAIGFSICLFQLGLQKSNDFDKFLAPLSEDAIKESFGNLEAAGNLYKAANLYYSLNKNNSGSWVDITRYFFQYDEMVKQHSYINFNKDPYYPFKPYTFEYNDLNVVDLEALKLLKILEKPESL